MVKLLVQQYMVINFGWLSPEPMVHRVLIDFFFDFFFLQVLEFHSEFVQVDLVREKAHWTTNLLAERIEVKW